MVLYKQVAGQPLAATLCQICAGTATRKMETDAEAPTFEKLLGGQWSGIKKQMHHGTFALGILPAMVLEILISTTIILISK